METTFDPTDYAKQCIKEKINEMFPEKIVRATVNLDSLIQITGVSRSTLEAKYLVREDFISLQVNEGKKRLWIYPDIRDLWIEIKLAEKENNNAKKTFNARSK